jgi:uncharacterized protein YkwD
MKSLALSLLAALTLIGAAQAQAESLYEPLVVVQPQPVVVRLAEEQQLVADINQTRAQQGLPPVTVDGLLTKAALLHAQDMARRRFFGHFTPDGASLPDRLDAVGFHWSVAAENIALDEDESHANAALLQSPDHRANILDPRVQKIGVAALGVGVGAALYVEDFAQ